MAAGAARNACTWARGLGFSTFCSGTAGVFWSGADASGPGGKPFYASDVIAGGHVYAVSRWNGVFVFAAKPEFKLVAHDGQPLDPDHPTMKAMKEAANQLGLRFEES